MPISRAVRNTRRAISPRLATSSARIICRSHPEDAVATAPLDRLVVHDRQRHAEDRAGVARVDDAVVVEPRGEEQRLRLRLDLVLDQLSHLPVLFLVVVLTAGQRRLPRADR